MVLETQLPRYKRKGGGTSVTNDNTTGSPLNIDYCVTNPQIISKPSDYRAPTFVQFDSFTSTAYFNDTSAVGGVIPTDIKEPRLDIEGDIGLSTIPSASSCLSDFQFLPNEVNCGFEAIAENIDEWRGNLVGRIKQYASTISDFQSTANSAFFSCDLNARSFSSVSARLDHFAERLNQQDQRISDNGVKIQSLISSVDQFQLISENQFVSLRDQIRVLSEASCIERSSSLPLQPVRTPGVE